MQFHLLLLLCGHSYWICCVRNKHVRFCVENTHNMLRMGRKNMDMKKKNSMWIQIFPKIRRKYSQIIGVLIYATINQFIFCTLSTHMNIKKTHETAKGPMKVFESSSHLHEKTQVCHREGSRQLDMAYIVYFAAHFVTFTLQRTMKRWTVKHDQC